MNMGFQRTSTRERRKAMKIEIGYQVNGYPVEFETEKDRTDVMEAYMERLKKESDENDG